MKTTFATLTMLSLCFAAVPGRRIASYSSPVPGVQEILQVATCATPAVGGTGVRHEILAGDGVPNSTLMVLRRPTANIWEAELNMTFVAAADIDAVEANRMREKVTFCLEQANPYLVGYQGQSLRLRLHDPATPARDGLVPPLITVNVVQPGRADAHNFPTGIDCGTILHETFHHLGLTDEYLETSGYDEAGQCRVVVPLGSIMAQGQQDVYNWAVGGSLECVGGNNVYLSQVTDEALEILTRRGMEDLMREEPLESQARHWCRFDTPPATRFAPGELARLTTIERGFRIVYRTADLSADTGAVRTLRATCACPRGDGQCADSLATVRDTLTRLYDRSGRFYRCPFGTNPGVDVRPNGEGAGARRIPNGVRVTNQPLGVGLLYPNQFYRIISGSCRAETQQTAYDRCARFAYTWSQPPIPAGGCAEVVPPECREPDLMLGGPRRLEAQTKALWPVTARPTISELISLVPS